MNTKEALVHILPYFAEHAGAHLGIVSALMIPQGLSGRQATDVVEFVPLAFGRVLMDGMGIAFPDDYVRLDENGNEKLRRKLADEPMFHAAIETAPWAMQNLGKDAFAAIAMCSAELDAVNQALNAGANPADLVLASPVMVWQMEEKAAPAKKPWWKFWR